MLIVFTTVSGLARAAELAEKIVREKLAACVQVLPEITSVYFWEGEVQKESEHLLLIKTLEEKFDELSVFIRANHSYSVPEIAAVPAERVSEDYLNWISDYVK